MREGSNILQILATEKNYLYNISDISYGFDNICILTPKIFPESSMIQCSSEIEALWAGIQMRLQIGFEHNVRFFTSLVCTEPCHAHVLYKVRLRFKVW